MKKIVLKDSITYKAGHKKMINNELEYTSCPLCKSVHHNIAYDNFHPYAVVQCRACSFYYLSPRMKESAMLQFYSNSTYFKDNEVGYESYVEQEYSLRATFHRLMLNLKKRNLTGGDLLEVGCGYGYLLDEAELFFNRRVGTELNRHAVEQASRIAEHIYEGGIDQIHEKEMFDLIITNQVIEHIYEPKMFIVKLLSHLKPGGGIVIATPNMDSLLRLLMRHHWPSFKIPEHVLYFNNTSLSTLMKQAGLVQIKSLPYPHAFPLSLIASKFRLHLPRGLGIISLWIPGTTIAMYGTPFNE